MEQVIQCEKLTKTYGKTLAINNISFNLEKNKIYGLLGKNGAGKTTLLNMISGHVFPTSGEIKVFNNILREGDTPKQLCYVKEKCDYFKNLTVNELLEMCSTFHSNWDQDFADVLVKKFKLNPHKKFKSLSRGMESMISIIIGLASRAELTIFDEPILGLDVLMRDKFYTILAEDFIENPRTIILSTHLIEEISKIVEDVYIIDHGDILLHDTVENITSKTYFLSGKASNVEEFINKKNVLHKESYGQGLMVAVYDSISEQEKAMLTKLDIALEGMPLQKFFAYFVGGMNDE